MLGQTVLENLFFSTTRIVTQTDKGEAVGTGFFFSYEHEGKNYLFIVTNKHVVLPADIGIFAFHFADGNAPILGKTFGYGVEQWEPDWFGHPDPEIDIAIYPFEAVRKKILDENKVNIFFRLVTSKDIPDSDALSSLEPIETVTFVGYPNGIWDTKHHLPIARSGSTATPLSLDFNGEPKFLIDASVFGGSSGSPVFLIKQGQQIDTDGNIIGSSPVSVFVGVISEVYYRSEENDVYAKPIPTHVDLKTKQHEMLDLGVVLKAKLVEETIEACLRDKNIID